MKASIGKYLAMRLLLLATALLGACSLSAQFTNARVLDEQSGLSDLTVRAIAKDGYGFVWIGTKRGLNRFDGSQIRQFLHHSDDPASLLNDDVRDLVIDSQRIWVGGIFGISSVNLQDFSIENIQFDCDGILDTVDLHHASSPDVAMLHKDGDILWICTRECGLMRYDIRARTLQRISFAEYANTPGVVSAGALDMIMGFTEDLSNDSIYWIGTAAGLIRFNRYTLRHEHFYKQSPDLLYQDGINTFRRVLYHDDGLIYYTTWGLGVNVFDPKTHDFFPLPLEGADLENPDLRTGVSDLKRHNAYNLWLRTQHGLNLYNTGLHKVIKFYPNQDATAQYRGVDFVDESGRRFIATNKGIYIYDPLNEQFLTFSYKELNNSDWYGFARKVVAHPDGNYITVLGQSVDGLYHFSHKDNSWFETPIPGHSGSQGQAFHGMDFEINDQYGWVFSELNGLYRFDPVHFTVTPVDLQIDLPRKKLADIEWDHEGNLWIGTFHEGILRWNSKTQKVTQFLTEVYGSDTLSETPLTSNLLCDSRGNIWFITAYGHSVYSAQDQQFYNFNTSIDPPRTLRGIAKFTEDKNGRIWTVNRSGVIASGSADHPEQGLVTQLSVFPNTMTPSYVEGIVYGEDNCLYVLSTNTLYRIDSTMEVSGFSMDYASFKGDYFSFDKLFESTLVVGLRNGFAIINSTRLRRNKELPLPYLTNVTINEKPYAGNFIPTPPTLSLKHFQNFVSFSFSAISYTLPDQNQFRYRLNDFDPDWISAGSRRFANYTNIPSGTYSFELQVANNEHLWNPLVYTVPVVIARAWWATWWFRIGVLLVAVSIGVMAYRYRVGQIRKESALKAEFDRKIGDVELSALRAQMNPHFIFNCLNSIENYIIKNESMKAAEYINDFARLIRLILQNSRSQYIPLTDEIEALDLYLQMESLRFDDKFVYHINLDENLEPSEIDIPPMLIQPFVENAIWHGLIPKNAPGNLNISLGRENGALRCVIEDDGIGREKSREINASMHKRGKKSMGMLITKNRIDVLNELYQTNATVQITDLRNGNGIAAGTRVELDIPIE